MWKLKEPTHYTICEKSVTGRLSYKTANVWGQVGIQRFCMTDKATSIVRDGRVLAFHMIKKSYLCRRTPLLTNPTPIQWTMSSSSYYFLWSARVYLEFSQGIDDIVLTNPDKLLELSVYVEATINHSRIKFPFLHPKLSQALIAVEKVTRLYDQ